MKKWLATHEPTTPMEYFERYWKAVWLGVRIALLILGALSALALYLILA